jgi:histidyl-tRNA synthetase
MAPSQPIKAARGMRDILPDERATWHFVERAAHEAARKFGYREIETPIVEPAILIERGVGGDSEVVRKEIYRLQPHSDSSQELALRPEVTASVVRAYHEHALAHGPQPARLYLLGSMFRHDRPQKGRYRHFHQFDCEAIGDDSPALDAELIELMATWLDQIGVSGYRLELNTIGDSACRPAYLKVLTEYYRPLKDSLDPDSQRNLATHPLRLLDSKDPRSLPFKAGAPRITEHLCPACAAAFAEVQGLLDAGGIEYILNPYLVRGLDYYTRTVFEFQHEALGGAQNALGGGGRYDGLAEALGWPSTPGVGFAAGMERVIDLAAAEGEQVVPAPAAELLVLPDGEGLSAAAAEVARRSRPAVTTTVDYSERSLKAKMRSADRVGARWVAILNPEEAARRVVQLRVMASGEQEEIPWDALPERLR